jgi:hypothetical protein
MVLLRITLRMQPRFVVHWRRLIYCSEFFARRGAEDAEIGTCFPRPLRICVNQKTSAQALPFMARLCLSNRRNYLFQDAISHEYP